MLLDQSLDVTVRALWFIFFLVMLVYFFRVLFQEGFSESLKIWLEGRVVGAFLTLLALTVFSSSLVFVAPQNVGVVVSLLSPDGIREQPYRSGLRWLVPFAEELVTYPIYWQNYTMSLRPLEGSKLGDDAVVARTFDGQEVSLDMSIIFRIEVDQVLRIHVDWQSRYIQDFIRPYVRGIVRTEVSQFTIDEINSFKRRDLETRLDELLREELEDKGFILDRFLLRNITFSSVYADSVEQKQVAFQDIITNRYEADQIRELAQGEADQIRIIAEGEADQLVIAANAQATSIAIIAQAEAEALEEISVAINEQQDLLTYEYINKIAPNVRVMLLPSENPLILNVPDLNASPPVPTQTVGSISPEALRSNPTVPTDIPEDVPISPTVTSPSSPSTNPSSEEG